MLPVLLCVDWESERASKWGRTFKFSLDLMRMSTGLYSMAAATPIRNRRLPWHSTARAFSSTCAPRREHDSDKWHRLLVQHHLQQLDSSEAVDSAEEEAAQHAHNQLRWIRQAAADQAHVVDRMVTELVQLDKPLAYVLGQFPPMHLTQIHLLTPITCTGTQPFYPLPVELLVRPPTLIPRPETEHWLNQLIDRLAGGAPPPLRILDIGTGSGCIALGLTYALRNRKEHGVPTVQTVAVDQSAEALALARENAHRCGLVGTPLGVAAPSRNDGPSKSTAATAPISFVLENLFSPTFTSSVLSALRGASSSPSPFSAARFNLVVSNPPYIPLHEYETLDASVREWEDRKALVGEMPPPLVVEPAEGRSVKQERENEDDGLVFYRRIISLLDTLLEPPPPPLSLRSDTLSSNSDSTQKDSAQEQGPPPPCVAFEVGKGQARAVEQLLLAWRPSSPRTTTYHDHSLSPDLDSGAQQQQRRLETEVVFDPWGVERAVFARWARRKEEEEE